MGLAKVAGINGLVGSDRPRFCSFCPRALKSGMLLHQQTPKGLDAKPASWILLQESDICNEAQNRFLLASNKASHWLISSLIIFTPL